MTITDTLRSLETAEDDDAGFLIAATINLYSESIRRRAGRVIWGPGDVKNLLSICKTLLAPPELGDQDYRPAKTRPEPNDVEKEMIADMTKLTAVAGRRA